MITGDIKKEEVTVCLADMYSDKLEYILVSGVKAFFIEDDVLRLTDGNGSTMAIFNMANVVSVY